VLCKHEVVGSIPSGSTSLRSRRELRLGKPSESEGCHAGAQGAKAGWFTELNIPSAKTSFRMHCLTKTLHA
jgi:hypothetical protein